ncbi:3-oxoacyl-[acyl-carrier-protein] reductase [Telmatospirillum siberiense]|uniref:3-oxoacyl-[acyl-carrier-protein] reductase n=1 Tax=Telmatospirillum siberiense TaxID=382514 RepID=A0A2N3PQ64_9PROT|nr:3-oxoacyl-[acyl-carrier-protein] reductase [Telmatospirillum siberiense]PKU22541.1 3-oxoacyl-[acyl-carrier-protein] reductase [Telmatospirillum siberiense]
MFDLTGKTALVTGASGDIGGAIARALQAQGAVVALSGTRRPALEALAAELGGTSPVLTCDLSDGSSVEQLAKDAEQALGSLDILVNNAGLTRDGLVLRMKDDDWQKVLDVNLSAAFRLSRAVVKGMMRRRFGRIVNITSIVGVTGNPGQVNYAASKAGLIGMSKALAQEVASRGITVNCIAPGFVTSAMTQVLTDEQKSKLLAGVPLGRMGDPAEIAAAAVYLASGEASYVTGQTLHVNGGMAMI